MSAAIAIGITGASGAPYWRRLLEVLLENGQTVHLTHSSNADAVCRAELSQPLSDVLASVEANASGGASLKLFASNDFYAPMASGSARYRGMIIVPCSMGSLGRIASGSSADLLTRAADVMLKERRRLVLLCRETPLNLVHLRNMTLLTEAGAVIMPASPGFYQKPEAIGDLVDFMVQRICDQLDLDVKLVRRWGGMPDPE
jgi:4-hydroxy-3-polyprenylbenzoate decarboxylase